MKIRRRKKIINMENFEEKTIKCKDCGKEFTWTVGEQRFYAERELQAPIRCKECRDARKARYEVKEEPVKTEEQKQKDIDDMLEKLKANTVSFR
jgi:DNA-directed RNA polymerase subunit RPC12/RpoP